MKEKNLAMVRSGPQQPPPPRIGAHRFIRIFAGDPARPDCPIDELLVRPRGGGGRRKRARSSTIAAGVQTDEALEDADSATSRTLNVALEAKGLKRIDTQVHATGGVGPVFRNVAPILDVLCKDRKGRFVPVEVKTGRPRRLRLKNTNDTGARGALSQFADTIALRHQAQLSVQVHCLADGAGTGYLAYFHDPSQPPVIRQLSRAVHVAIGETRS
jgi:hypothetical protein